jgi:hypothetical protein
MITVILIVFFGAVIVLAGPLIQYITEKQEPKPISPYDTAIGKTYRKKQEKYYREYVRRINKELENFCGQTPNYKHSIIFELSSNDSKMADQKIALNRVVGTYKEQEWYVTWIDKWEWKEVWYQHMSNVKINYVILIFDNKKE